MKEYLGHKRILAQPMTRQEYNDYRGWALPADENGADKGYLVEYLDGGATNHPDHAGYISWSPADVFHRAYRPNGSLTFGDALVAVKAGARAQRDGWNGKGMFVFLVPGSQFHVNREPLLSILGDGTKVTYRPHIDICQPDGSIGVWQPSMGDVMAEDWRILE